MTKLLDVQSFRQAAKDGGKPEGAVVRAMADTPIVLDGDSRQVRFCFSDGSVDRYGDTIAPEGWDLTSFLKNPVALFAHDSWSPPIGRAKNVFVEGARLMGDIEFMDAETYPLAETIFRMVKGGWLNATSVGFLPVEWDWANDKARPWGIDFTQQELLEISVVPVPANANALVEARSTGIDTTPMIGWAEQLLDSGGKTAIARKELEDLRRAAGAVPITRYWIESDHKLTVAQATAIKNAFTEWRRNPGAPLVLDAGLHLKASGSEWKVGAARDLPIDEQESWDGPAAAARMFEAAGFNGDNPNPAKARRGFLIYDAADPTLKGSYKLPFADIVDGNLKAVDAGIRAAASRLPQTDAPQEVLDEARGVIDAYQEKMKPGDDSKSVNAEIRAGKVLSKKNEDAIRQAHGLISGVLAQLPEDDPAEPEPDDDADDQKAARMRRAQALQRKVRLSLN